MDDGEVRFSYSFTLGEKLAILTAIFFSIIIALFLCYIIARLYLSSNEYVCIARFGSLKACSRNELSSFLFLLIIDILLMIFICYQYYLFNNTKIFLTDKGICVIYKNKSQFFLWEKYIGISAFHFPFRALRFEESNFVLLPLSPAFRRKMEELLSIYNKKFSQNPDDEGNGDTHDRRKSKR